jgi:hypothetical protein
MQFVQESTQVEPELEVPPDFDAAEKLAREVLSAQQSSSECEGLAHGDVQRGRELQAERDLLECGDRNSTRDSLFTLAKRVGIDARQQVVQRLAVDGQC